jgi:8-oxo-dGTP diphosphatase
MSRKPRAQSTKPTPTAPDPTKPAQVTVAAVLQVREGVLQALLWQRALEPFSGAWALPGGVLAPDETLEASIRRHLAVKVDLGEVAHLEQVATYGDPGRNPVEWEIATAYLGLVPLGVDPSVPTDTGWHPVDDLPPTAFDHGAIVHSARDRLRGKLSYSNIGFALAPATFTLNELRDVYTAALGYDVSATNLKRVLIRRGALVRTGGRRDSGRAGGRPAEEFAFAGQALAITDPFAALRPPDMRAPWAG